MKNRRWAPSSERLGSGKLRADYRFYALMIHFSCEQDVSPLSHCCVCYCVIWLIVPAETKSSCKSWWQFGVKLSSFCVFCVEVTLFKWRFFYCFHHLEVKKRSFAPAQKHIWNSQQLFSRCVVWSNKSCKLGKENRITEIRNCREPSCSQVVPGLPTEMASERSSGPLSHQTIVCW